MTFKKILIANSLILFSFTSFAGDEPVNCRQEIVDYQDIYAGVPQCDASYERVTCRPIDPFTVEVTTENLTHTLMGNYRESTSQNVTLTELISYTESYSTPGNLIGGRRGAACTLPTTVSETLFCTAQLDFLEQRPVKQEVCDYTPDTNLTPSLDSRYNSTVRAKASDRDGSIVKYEWWVDGVKQSESGESLFLENIPYSHHNSKNVEVRVTDDDGYTTTESKIVVFRNQYICRRC
jgi:hypothetical protein